LFVEIISKTEQETGILKLKELGLDLYCDFNNILSKSQIKEVEENMFVIFLKKNGAPDVHQINSVNYEPIVYLSQNMVKKVF